jgi:hypothetical protein
MIDDRQPSSAGMLSVLNRKLGQSEFVYAHRSRSLTVFASFLAGLLAAGVIGYVIGRGSPRTITVRTGTVYETSNEGTANADGFNYALPAPVNITWVDFEGTIHDGSQPPCIHLGKASRVVFATVTYPIAGSTQGRVIWVRC